jgi:hypothetical protein
MVEYIAPPPGDDDSKATNEAMELAAHWLYGAALAFLLALFTLAMWGMLAWHVVEWVSRGYMLPLDGMLTVLLFLGSATLTAAVAGFVLKLCTCRAPSLLIDI